MSYFSYVGKLFSNVKGFYNEINAATLTGSIDAVIIKQEDGTYLSSPFHVRFGKLGVLRAKEKVVDIEINGVPVEDLHMKLGEAGEAFFVQEVDGENEEDFPAYLATSPLPSSTEDLMAKGISELRKEAELEESRESGEQQQEKSSEAKSSHEMPRQEVVINVELDTEEAEASTSKIKKRRRRKTRKKGSGKEKVESDSNLKNTDGEMFDMDHSSDEEVASLMGRSTSLPAFSENSLQRTDMWASAQYDSFLHPFSDTDLSPVGSPMSTRPATPKSDTEVDVQRSEAANDQLLLGDDNTWWEWGDLPHKPKPQLVNDMENAMEGLTQQQSQGMPTSSKHEPENASGGLFQFMRKTKKIRHTPENQGIYLDDLNLEEMDSETAKLYFPKRFSTTFESIKEKEHEDDTESGRGASLPQSPHSVEGAIGGPPVSFTRSEVRHLGMFSLSLCGGLADPEDVTLEKFMQKIVTYEDLCENPGMIANTDLVVRIGDKYYNWATAAPMILSQVVFHQDLPKHKTEELISQHMPKKKERKSGVVSWFSWRRTTADYTPPIASAEVSGTTTVASMSDSEISTAKQNENMESRTSLANIPSAQSTPKKKKLKSSDRLKEDDQSSDEETDSEHSSRRDKSDTTCDEKYMKTIRLTSEQITKLNLFEGQNEITFSVTTQYQGTTRCTSHIYLWNYNDKIIVSDIDGTITKSDVLGQILPIMGRDWSQSGVAQLFTRIHNNGYKFLYLSARAIGQSRVTKDLLRSIKQDEVVLPDGPLLLSPTSLISAFHREVIEKKPEVFKISCLKDIADLFPSRHPFYAGFGNKINDVWAYKAISIPIHRIFTINPRGELRHEQSYTFQSSYANMTDVSDHFFPPVHKVSGTPIYEFSSITFWRPPLPPISDDELSAIYVQNEKVKSTDTTTAEKK